MRVTKEKSALRPYKEYVVVELEIFPDPYTGRLWFTKKQAKQLAVKLSKVVGE